MPIRHGWTVRRPPDRLVAGALLCAALSACGGGGVAGGGDWKSQQTAIAEQKVRDTIADPAAPFPHTDVVGDDKTGQVCGLVSPHGGAPVRFVFYIDQTAGPYVDESGNVGVQQQFEAAWQADCIHEGYC
jgi:hypothetical protein